MQTYDVTQREHQEAWSDGSALNCVTIRCRPRDVRHTHLNHYGYCHLIYTTDPRHVVPAKGSGFKIGYLHEFIVGHDPAEEAQRFTSYIAGTNLVPAVEVGSIQNEWSEEIGRFEKATHVEELQAFLALVETATGRKVLIRTSAEYWNDHFDSDAFKSNPLWVVDYTTYADEGHKAAPVLPRGWAKYVMWDFTDGGHNGQGWRGTCDFSLVAPDDYRTLVLE